MAQANTQFTATEVATASQEAVNGTGQVASIPFTYSEGIKAIRTSSGDYGDQAEATLDGGFTLNLFVSAAFRPQNGEHGYRPQTILGPDGTTVWSWKQAGEKNRLTPYVFLLDDGEKDVPILAFVHTKGFGHRAVRQVVFAIEVSKLATHVLSEDDQVRCTPQLGAMVSLPLKQAAMEATGVENVFYTSAETICAKREDDKHAEARRAKAEADRKVREAQAEADRKAKAARQAEIQNRQIVKMVGERGQELFGVPVTGDEWEALTNGQWAVEEHANNTYTHFRVELSGQKKLRKHVQVAYPVGTVAVTLPTKAGTPAVTKMVPQGQISVEANDDFFDINWYAYTKGAVKTLREQGVHGIVAVKNAEGKLAVYNITADDAQSVQAVIHP